MAVEDLFMDDIFICPECRAAHDDPLEATLGHFALCLTCAVVIETLATREIRTATIRRLAPAAPRTIRPAA